MYLNVIRRRLYIFFAGNLAHRIVRSMSVLRAQNIKSKDSSSQESRTIFSCKMVHQA